jgi:hypothetical protein
MLGRCAASSDRLRYTSGVAGFEVVQYASCETFPIQPEQPQGQLPEIVAGGADRKLARTPQRIDGMLSKRR